MEFVLRLQKQRQKKVTKEGNCLRGTYDDDGIKSDSEVHRKATVRKKVTKVKYKFIITK